MLRFPTDLKHHTRKSISLQLFICYPTKSCSVFGDDEHIHFKCLSHRGRAVSGSTDRQPSFYIDFPRSRVQ
ncbi:hypothetical protein EYF80_060108 [Liparis tanakae]|uniref:Uncharacterized protein n=1 Tax=Liparis tanakae TaxID=230148 RepID=A0A4Z2ELM1_9TELE|nr:hypothetical protein EYF80_060108 [Liparis tanakae]